MEGMNVCYIEMRVFSCSLSFQPHNMPMVYEGPYYCPTVNSVFNLQFSFNSFTNPTYVCACTIIFTTSRKSAPLYRMSQQLSPRVTTLTVKLLEHEFFFHYTSGRW